MGLGGVRVNTLLPGWIQTELTQFLRDAPDGGAGALARVPMQRWGQPAEIAAGAVFLASDASSFMTGQGVGPGRRPDGHAVAPRVGWPPPSCRPARPRVRLGTW